MIKYFTKIIKTDYPAMSEKNIQHFYDRFNEYKDFDTYEELFYYYKNTKPTKILEEINYYLTYIYLPF